KRAAKWRRTRRLMRTSARRSWPPSMRIWRSSLREWPRWTKRWQALEWPSNDDRRVDSCRESAAPTLDSVVGGLEPAGPRAGLVLGRGGDESAHVVARSRQHARLPRRLLPPGFSAVAPVHARNGGDGADRSVGYGPRHCLLDSPGHPVVREPGSLVGLPAGATPDGCLPFDQ